MVTGIGYIIEQTLENVCGGEKPLNSLEGLENGSPRSHYQELLPFRWRPMWGGIK